MTSKQFQELRKRLKAAPVKADVPIDEARAAYESLMTQHTPAADVEDIVEVGFLWGRAKLSC
jgi:hypothetical protein